MRLRPRRSRPRGSTTAARRTPRRQPGARSVAPTWARARHTDSRPIKSVPALRDARHPGDKREAGDLGSPGLELADGGIVVTVADDLLEAGDEAGPLRVIVRSLQPGDEGSPR